jgi:hypothetical protein
VGQELERVRFALLQEAVDDPQFHQSAHFVLINYFAFSQASAITPNHEIEEWAWVTPEQAFTYPLNTFTRLLVQRFIDLNTAAAPGSGSAVAP